MHFKLLQTRLVAHIRERVRSGELTERGLARLTGVSQPHLHNVLKGIRTFSIEMADRILQRLRMSALDLLDPAEVEALARLRGAERCEHLEVPVLEGVLGPGHPYPARESAWQRYPFRSLELAGVGWPAVARVGADGAARGLFDAGDHVLLDRSEGLRQTPAAEGYYALETSQGGLIRQVSRQGEDLRLDPGGLSISLADRNILEIVKARVVWIGHYLEPRLLASRPVEEAGGEDRRAG